MSIFPKRSIPGSSVTIHWNFNTVHLTDKHVFPYVRIGVQSPDGKTTMLFEQHVLGLPSIQSRKEMEPSLLLHLNKNTPLLVLADYLSTHHKREQLIQILQNIQAGRHYYFIYHVPADAPPGKYTLISEVHNGGSIRYSTTAPDDFFLIEKITIEENEIVNHSNEPTPVKIVTYQPDNELRAEDIKVFEMPPGGSISISSFPGNSFLLYNEERITLPLQNQSAIRCIRNQRALCLPKDETLHILFPNEEVCTLTTAGKSIWEKADGVVTREELCAGGNEQLYQEMVDKQLIIELNTL